MNNFLKTAFLVLLTSAMFFLTSFRKPAETTKYKCLVQMVNYKGEGAYVIASLIDPDGHYDETLYILGEDDEWYHEITEWWQYFGKKKRSVDGITGATLSGGERNIILFDVDTSILDKGYKIRFESSVEDQKYHVQDVEIPLTSEMPKDKIDGSGYVRYVRIMPN